MKPPLTTEARKTPDDIVLARVTPRTDIREQRVKGPNAWSPHDFGAVSAIFARELERENQVLTEALEEAQAWKKSQLAVTAWWAEVDAFVRNHPESLAGDSVSANALKLLRSRDALAASEERTASAVKDILHDLPAVECNSFHHASKDRHKGFDCPCYDRWQAATVAANKALAQRPTP